MIEQQHYDKINSLVSNVETIIQGKTDVIKKVIAALLAGGHVLLEDNPGTGKTVLAKTLAASISGANSTASFKRIQFTPDLLPMDLIGSHIFDDGKKDFVFKRGPLFCNILLADEINRASPKVQSALLECMAENQITVGDATYELDKIFFTIATQNPIESEGTYPLPAAQLDRFFMKLSLGYANASTELNLLSGYTQLQEAQQQVPCIMSLQELLALKQLSSAVYVHPAIVQAVQQLLEATRHHAGITLPASTRSGIALLKCLRGYALVNNRNFVTEEDLSELTLPVLQHRLEFKQREASQKAMPEILAQVLKQLGKLQITNTQQN